MIRVLHFFKTYKPDTNGGTESFIYQLAENSEKHGIVSEVLFVSPRGSAMNESLSSHTTHRASRNIKLLSTDISFSAISMLNKLLPRYDILHVHFPWPFMDLVLAMLKPTIPIVLTYHSDIIKQKFTRKIYHPLMMRTLDKVDAIVTTSPVYSQTSPYLYFYQNKITTIPFGLSENYFVEPSINVEQNYKQWIKKRYILFIGKLRYYKGLQYLIPAMKNIECELLVIGNGGIELELKKMVDDMKINNVHFLGEVSEQAKNYFLKNSYAFVFPSHLRSEAFGISLLEACFFSKPMLTCEIGTGTSYVNINGETGLVVEPCSKTAIKDAVNFLLENENIAYKMGQNARKRFNQYFTDEQMISAYKQLYLKLIS